MLTRPGQRVQRGFTLIEAMVVVAVVAVVASIAAPSLATMVTNNRVRTAADGLLSGLQLARAEAIRRNTLVSFTLDTAPGWTVAVVAPAATVQRRPAGEGSGSGLQITSLNNQTNLRFDATGMVAGFNTAANLSQVTIAPPAGAAGDSLRIDVFAGGQIRLCNLSITRADDPRRC